MINQNIFRGKRHWSCGISCILGSKQAAHKATKQ